jgi:hypothetical protein
LLEALAVSLGDFADPRMLGTAPARRRRRG